MSTYESCGASASGAASRSRGSSYDPEALIARTQWLAQMPRPPGGYPLEAIVEAAHLGDLTAIATLSLRAQRY